MRRTDELAYQVALSERKGDFTPGANLTPEQIKRVLSFATCKGKTNDETLANMAKLFEPKEQQCTE